MFTTLSLAQMRENIERYTMDNALEAPPAQNAPDAASKVWLEALRNNEILFENGDYGRVRYKRFRDINFLGPEFQNQEWRAQLNRFHWLGHLAADYIRSGSERNAEIARETIEAWMDFRTFTGQERVEEVWPATGDNTLSTSIRLGFSKFMGWWGTLPYLEGSRHIDEAFIQRAYRSTLDQLVFLYNNNCKHGNFRISELDTFIFLSQVLPGLEKYRDYAVRQLNECFAIQVESDGSHVEHTSGYHHWMQDVFTRYALLSMRRPELGLCIDHKKLMRMWDYGIANYTPDGQTFGIGDDVRWFPGRKGVCLEDICARRKALLRTFGMEDSALPADAGGGCFPDAGQYFLHSKEGKTVFVLDATDNGGFHFHPARGAILCYHGDALQLCDTGSLNYERSDPFCAPGRMSQMHNTVTVNNWSQVTEADAAVSLSVDTPEVALLQCVYNGGYTNYRNRFEQHVPVAQAQSCAGMHVRTFLWLKGRFALALDSLSVPQAAWTYAAHWQFQPGILAFDPGTHSVHTTSGTCNLLLRALWTEDEVESRLYEGDFQRMLGWVAKDGGKLGGGEPAPMLSVEGSIQGKTRTRMLHILAPYEKEVPEVSAQMSEVDNTLHFTLGYNGESWHFAAELRFLDADACRAQIGERGPLQSDGMLAVAGRKDGEELFAWQYNGSYVAMDGKKLL